MTSAERIGANIREWRNRRGLTQAALGELIGSDGPRVGRLEKGAENPTVDTLDKLVVALQIGLEDLTRPRSEEPGHAGRERNPILEEHWRTYTEAADAEIPADDSIHGDILRAIAVLGRALGRPSTPGKAHEVHEKARR